MFLSPHPWVRNIGQNAPNWNHRVKSSVYSGVPIPPSCGVYPPMSVVQYGIPLTEKLSPAGICNLNVGQSPLMSPDHVTAELRCCPEYAERVRMNTTLVARVRSLPSCTAVVVMRGYAL